MATSVAGARSTTGLVRAAGAVAWRERDGRLEVALVHRPRYRDWSFPKGKLDPGESVSAAAVREVAEEIGSPVVLGVPLPTLRYRLADGRRKRVVYWAARVADGDDAPALAARPAVTPAAPDEIDDVVWMSARAAHDTLTRDADRGQLAAVVDLWSRGRLATDRLVLVRHGQAVKRSEWSDGEATRPLAVAGRAQADALVPVLAAFGVRRVVTSPWARCTQTVEPFARASGLEPVHEAALTQGAHEADPAAARAVVAGLLPAPGATALCTHRPVLGTAVKRLQRAQKRWTDGRLPDADPWLRPGEVLVAHLTPGGALVAVERHRPGRV